MATPLSQRSLILLAGGESRRMGRNKAYLPLAGEPMAARILHRLKGVGKPLLAAGCRPFPSIPGIPVVQDHWPGCGPLAGIHAGLVYGNSELNLVVACDMPFVSRELAGFLLEKAEKIPGADALVPRAEGRIHPLFAVYRRRTFPFLEEILQENTDRSVTRFLERTDTIEVGEEEWHHLADPRLALLNMNRPGDYDQVRKRVEQEHTKNHPYPD
ncbi:molybdenum cofactor guanylyltransferase [Salinithrix halophila]|uniref:Probable molybdenum cofactor guanylyltransferase n=1 Tax=Salinithrix halophila TaxID=1485204 RepID=A0ABV8JA68_9BACL